MTDGRRCIKCGVEYAADEVASGQAFRSGGGVRRRMHLATTCRPCEDTARDVRKGEDRWSVKANDTTRRHAVRLRTPKGLGPSGQSWHDPHLTAERLIAVYGWGKAQMSHDASFLYDNGCSYCHRKYKGMGHDAADITLDIFDPRLPPQYGINTRWCCMTCQRRKSLLLPDKWAIKMRIYQKWDAARVKGWDPIADDPGSLFYAVTE